MSDDFDFEPATGVPDQLPHGERIMWQGAPRWRSLVRHAFHADKIALYFGALIALRLLFGWHDGLPASEVLAGAFALSLAAVLALIVVGLLAWQSVRSTVYTLTTKRLVIRYGMALPVTLNIPLKRIASAHLAPRSDATGDIAIVPEAGTRLAYVMLWPHVRAWHLKHPEPTLRSIADADQVAQLVGEALRSTASQTTTRIVRLRPAATATPSYQPAASLSAAE